MRTIGQDVRFGLRMFLGHPWFSLVAVLTLGIGIAANTTVFSWIDTLLLRPYPGASGGGSLVLLENSNASAPNGGRQLSYLDWRDYSRGLRGLTGIALHREDVFSLGDESTESQAVWGEVVTANYFDVLGVRPYLGRTFNAEEAAAKPGAHPVAVVSYGLWRQRFRGDRGAVGKTLRVNRLNLTVIGVAPPEFRGTMAGLSFQIWVPVTMGEDLGMLRRGDLDSRARRRFYAVARLANGVSRTQAGAEARTLASALEAAYPETNRGIGATVSPVWAFSSGAQEMFLKPLRILLAASLAVFLIACFNVANLLMARAAGRRTEISVRMALGASGGRLSRQMFTETLILAGAGAAAGVALSFWLSDLLPAVVPRIHAPVALGFNLNPGVLGFTALAFAAAALLAGSAPALVWRKIPINEALKEGGRGGGSGATAQRMRTILVALEVSLATVALVGAGLFLRSLRNAREIDPGFRRDDVVLGRFYLRGSGMGRRDLQSFCLRLRDRLRANRSVRQASYATYAPLGSNSGPYTDLQVEGYVPALGESMNVNNTAVAPDYFGALDIPLTEGRDFRDSDDENAAPVAIVTRAFARRYFGGRNPVGRRVKCFGSWRTIIGLAGDLRYFDITETPRPHLFLPYRQVAGPDDQLYYFLRISGAPEPAMAALDRESAAAGPRGVAVDAMRFRDWTEVTLLPQLVAANLLSALALIAVILAGVGLYGVMAYAVSQRTVEIGIRVALGARPRDAVAGIVRSALALTAAGLAGGLAASLAAGRFLAAMLVGVSAADPMVFISVAVFLAAVAFLASYVPARRAARVDPMVALRCT